GIMLARGEIVAIKGIGGFHLACDATSQVAVVRLRARKHREEKPLAVMVASLEQAETLAKLRASERRLLASPERPIVLCERRANAPLAPAIRRTIRWSACSWRPRRCITCCSPKPRARW